MKLHVLAVIAASFTLTVPALAAPERADDIRDQVRLDQRIGETLPLDLQLRDSSGEYVRLGDLIGDKPVVITPVFFSCPMLCNITIDQLINRMSDVRLDVGRDFEIITYSFDHRDTVADAAEKRDLYLRRYGRAGAGEGWKFLTGDEQSVKQLSDALGFHYAWDEKKQEFAHPASTIVVTPEGKIGYYFFGFDYTSRDLRYSLIEASDNRLGSVADKIMLLCYDYDPGTGKYSATAMNMVRLGGVATVAGLGGFIFIMLRRERSADKSQEERKA